ncbi:MAG: Ig-like domain-containing protein [Oscillospiraceae bacterium]|nr:Ig-like domain-containing protein [Oscillospiraceae bacterium]
MKKMYIMILGSMISALMLSGCGKVVTESVDINYNQEYSLENEALSKYNDIVWTSDNDDIAVPSGNSIIGKSPGTAILTGSRKNKVIAEYTVNVKKITESIDVDFNQEYTIDNEALSDISWSSDNEEIAVISGNTVIGKGPGSAMLSGTINDNIVAEYTVNVNIVPITGIVLSTNATEIAVGDGFQLNYSLFPENASDYGITWRSADPSVADVNKDGYILAKNKGQTTISASNKEGIMATCSVTVKTAKPNLKKIYDDLHDSYYCSLSSDENSLTIDSNPLDIDDYSSVTAWGYIKDINEKLELSGLTDEMSHTRAMDGRQTRTYESLTVSWSYHPDQGINVVYSVQ